MYKVSNLLLVTFDRRHIEFGLLHLPHINCQEFDEAFRSPIHPEEHASAPLLCVWMIPVHSYSDIRHGSEPETVTQSEI
jgi:hypothetical protein